MAIPNSILKPGTYVTIDNSKALQGALVSPSKTVIFGQLTSDGSATAEQMVQVFSKENADGLFGIGSMLGEMFDKWFDGTIANQVYAVPMTDAGGSTVAEWTITITGPSTAAGTLAFYINGNLVSVGVSSGDSADDIATAIVTAIGAATTDSTLPVTASAVAEVVTLVHKNGGTVGNQTKIKQNLAASDATPAGVTAVIAVDVVGATDIDIDDAIAALPSDLINWFVSPYNDTVNVGKLATEIDDRWDIDRQIDGHAIISKGGDSSAVIAYGDALNSEHLTVMDAGKDSPTPEYLWTVATAAPIAYSADIDVAQPFKTLELNSVLGDTLTDKRNFNESNSLLIAGVSTHKISDDGTVRIERMNSTYKKNPSNAPDASYRNLNTLTITSALRQSRITMIETTYSRHKLANDGQPIPSGQPIVTPAVMKGSFLSLYQAWIDAGVVQDIDGYNETLVITINGSDPSRLDIFERPFYISPFYQADIQMQFRLN